jgi:hypothetical protein
MPDWTVEIEGSPLTEVSHVNRINGDESELGKAAVEVANIPANRAVESGDDGRILRNGDEIFRGKVTKAPTKGQTGEQIEYTLKDKRVVLEYIESHRPYYQMDPGAIIREAINKQADVRSPVTVSVADNTSNWSTNIPEFGTIGSAPKQLYEFGSDALFAGWRGGSEGDYHLTYTNVPSSAIPGDGQIVRLTTRMLVNNRGSQVETEVDLRDNAGNNYIWQPERTLFNYDSYEFLAENAETTATIGSKLQTDGAIQFRFNLKGELPEPRAVSIDHIETLPFALKSRTTSLSTNNVQNTGNTITRRLDESVLTTLKTFAVEEQYASWVDTNDDLHFEPAGSIGSGNDIVRGTTSVTDAEFNRDYDEIVNKVTVQGAEEIQVTAVDNASVKFYGLSEREEQIVDSEIQTEAEAERRATGFLQENAWDDGAMSFEIADATYENVRVGQTIKVEWPPENINNDYVVSSVETDVNGFVTVNIGGAQLG